MVGLTYNPNIQEVVTGRLEFKVILGCGESLGANLSYVRLSLKINSFFNWRPHLITLCIYHSLSASPYTHLSQNVL